MRNRDGRGGGVELGGDSGRCWECLARDLKLSREVKALGKAEDVELFRLPELDMRV